MSMRSPTETVTIVGGVMEHIEEAGVHSGDSACVLPPHSLPDSVLDEIHQATRDLAAELKVCGLMNIQFAVKADGDDFTVYLLEVNPRASRTSPFVSKATGRSLARIAAKVMVGVSLAEQGFTEEIWPTYTSVKESVFPFQSVYRGRHCSRVRKCGPPAKSWAFTKDFPMAFAKAQTAAGAALPAKGKVFISMAASHKQKMIEPARQLQQLGFEVVCTSGTARVFRSSGHRSADREKAARKADRICST